MFRVQSSGKKEVTGADVLVAIFSEKQSRAVHFLGLQSISRLDVVNDISYCTPLGSEENSNEEPLVPHYKTPIEGSLDRLVGTQIAMGKRLDRIEALLDEVQRLLVEKGHRKDEQ